MESEVRLGRAIGRDIRLRSKLCLQVGTRFLHYSRNDRE